MIPTLEDFIREIKEDCNPSNREELVNWVGTMQSKFQVDGGIIIPKTIPTKDSLYIAYCMEFMKVDFMDTKHLGDIILIGYIYIDSLYKSEFYLSNKLKPKSNLILN